MESPNTLPENPTPTSENPTHVQENPTQTSENPTHTPENPTPLHENPTPHLRNPTHLKENPNTFYGKSLRYPGESPTTKTKIKPVIKNHVIEETKPNGKRKTINRVRELSEKP